MTGADRPRVALVVVSHSARLADGVREIAGQMAPDVAIQPAGGDAESATGTDFDRIAAALDEAVRAAPGGVVVLYDLGSARLTAELAVEAAPDADRVRVIDAPLVEGALAAAVAAQGGADLDGVATAAASAGGGSDRVEDGADGADGAGGAHGADDGADDGDGPADAGPGAAVERRAVLADPLGLHARPAAALGALARRLAAATGAPVRVAAPGGAPVDATALLQVVGLGLRGGAEVVVTAATVDAADEVADLLATVGAPDPAIGSDRASTGRSDPATGSGRASTSRPPVPNEDVGDGPDGVLRGAPGSPGLAVGPLVELAEPDPVLPDRAPAEDEADRARDAADRATAALDAEARAGQGQGVAAVHAALLADPDLRAAVDGRLAGGATAERAWWDGAAEVAERMRAGPDALLAERAADVRDAALRVLAELGVAAGPPAGAHLEGAVVLADDLPPSWVAALAAAGAAGIALRGSGPTAHAAVLARGLALPAVVGLGPGAKPADGDGTAVLDGDAGTLEPAASRERADAARRDLAAQRDEADRRRRAARDPVVVAGRRVPVLANVGSAAEAQRADAEGADGVGLLRTEFLLTGATELPTEDEQVDALVAIASALPGRRVVVRTFDVGGDKPVPALDLDPVRHGFLGERGLRHGLRHPDLLATQLRAVLRAGAAVAEHGVELAVMAPMVTVAEEAREFRDAVGAAADALAAAGVPHTAPAAVGVMVEVPAAALTVAELAPHVDFVSVGTNDLVQYVMAAERTNAAVADLYRPDSPAVWRLLELLVADAHRAGVEVAVCGQLAADPGAAARLVALGVDELSVPPAAVPAIKEHLRAPIG